MPRHRAHRAGWSTAAAALPDVAASDNREHVVDLGDLQICEVIEHKAHGHGQAAVGLPIGLTNEAHKRLRNKEAGQRIEIAVNIAYGYKQAQGVCPMEAKST